MTNVTFNFNTLKGVQSIYSASKIGDADLHNDILGFGEVQRI